MLTTKTRTLCFVLFIISHLCFSQVNFSNKKLDSIYSLDYKSLVNAIKSSRPNINTSNFYTDVYMAKAKKDSDTLRILKAFHWYHIINIKTCGFKYADSIIELSEGKDYVNYPLIAYDYKGHILYKQRNFIESLDNYLKIQEINKTNNPRISNSVDFKIALIKNRLGHHEQAIKLFKKLNNHYDFEKTYNDKQGALFGLGDSFRQINELDSSLYYNNLGLKKAISVNDDEFINYFDLNIGATLSDKQDIENSNILLKKVLLPMKKMKDKPNIAMCHFFLGRNFHTLGNTEKALFHLKKMDSVFLDIKDLHPELRQGYEILKEHYAKNKQLEKQLLYVNRLLKLDSILLKNYKYLSQKISNEYDNQKLLKEKEKLINAIEDENSNYSSLLIGISTILIIVVLLLFRLQLQRKREKQKMKSLLDNLEHQKLQSKDKSRKENIVSNYQIDIGINDKVVNQVLRNLELFERNLEFRNFDLSAVSLSKSFDTNSTYLSKIINHYKEQPFSSYVNSLRVDYAIEKLKDDKKFSTYTIKAIANEVGFKSTESFTKAFHKKTGLTIKSFLKQLKEIHQNL